MQILNVPQWDGKPSVVGDVFVLKKGNRTARRALQSHPLGLELRLTPGSELLQSLVCRSQDKVLDTFERWRAAMQEKGWR